MSYRIICDRIVLIPSEGRPLDDVDYPGFLHAVGVGPDRLRIEVIGTSHRRDDEPVAPEWEIEGDRPSIEMSLSIAAAQCLAEALLDEAARAVRSGTSSLEGDDRPS